MDCSRSTILLTAGDVITLAFLVCALALDSFILLTCCKSAGSLLCPLVPVSIQRQLHEEVETNFHVFMAYYVFLKKQTGEFICLC